MNCSYLTVAQKDALESAGWWIVSGPHNTLDDCLEVCVLSQTGTGTGTSILTGGITTLCCPSNPLPATLVGEFYNKLGDCSCLPGAFVLEWDGSGWSATIITPDCTSVSIDISVRCLGTTWVLISTECGIASVAANFVQCGPPLKLIWANLTCAAACTGRFDLSISE